MQLDLDRLKNRADNSDELKNEAQGSIKRKVWQNIPKINHLMQLEKFLLAHDESCCKER